MSPNRCKCKFMCHPALEMVFANWSIEEQEEGI